MIVTGPEVDALMMKGELETLRTPISQVDDAPPSYEWDNPTSAPAAPGPVSTPTPRREPVSASQVMYQPAHQRLVNNFSLFSRDDSISGTYLIDPKLPDTSTSNANKPDRSINREHSRHIRRAFGAVPASRSSSSSCSSSSSKSDSGCGGTSRRPDVNAAFQTRNGSIKLDLAIVVSGAGYAIHDKAKDVHAHVMLNSRNGRIDANLLEIQQGRRVNLDISTRNGGITVFLPATFSGPVAFRTRSGLKSIHFLPAFAERARVVQGSEREMLVVLSPEPAAGGDSKALVGEDEDCCYVGTRNGRITIGITGMDELPDIASLGKGLVEKIGALVEAGTKQLGTWMDTQVPPPLPPRKD